MEAGHFVDEVFGPVWSIARHTFTASLIKRWAHEFSDISVCSMILVIARVSESDEVS
jgi:hypothetical protein